METGQAILLVGMYYIIYKLFYLKNNFIGNIGFMGLSWLFMSLGTGNEVGIAQILIILSTINLFRDILAKKSL